jgi:hypothetical protein
MYTKRMYVHSHKNFQYDQCVCVWGGGGAFCLSNEKTHQILR